MILRSDRLAADARGSRAISWPTRRPTPTSGWSIGCWRRRHIGERWARHWLDVVGYADSNGYTETDAERKWAYKYRDYVIRAIQRRQAVERVSRRAVGRR